MSAPQLPNSAGPSDPTKSSRARWGMILFALLFLLTPTSCGDDKKSQDDGGANFDFSSLRESAEDARASAKAAEADKYAPGIFEKGEEYLAKAAEYEDENPSKAKQRYKNAKNKFNEAVTETKKNKGKADEFAAKLKSYEVERDRLKAAGAATLAEDAFTKAEEGYAAAKQAIEAGDSRKAENRLRYATRDLAAAESLMGRLSKARADADEERNLMTVAKDKAVAENAEALAGRDFSYASDTERDAMKSYESKDFGRALSQFRNAKNAYSEAAQAAIDAKAAVATNVRPGPGSGDGGSTERSDPAPEVGEIDIPDLGSDDEFDLTDLPSLFNGLAEFKDNGAFELDWSSGIEFQKDVTVVAGKLGGAKANIIWEGEEGVGAGEDNYVFAGNTGGHILVNCGFEDAASVKTLVQFQLLTQNPVFEIVLMSDDGKWYSSEFAVNIFSVSDGGRLKKPKARAAQATYRTPFNKWVQKREPYELVFTYHKPNEDTEGVLICKLNGEETARFESDAFRRGKVGFRWHNVKFIVKELQVLGFPDEAWATEALKKRNSGDGDGGSTGGGGFGF